MLRLRYFPIAISLALCLAGPGIAAEDWSLCRLPSFQYIGNDNLGPEETLVEAQTIASEDSESIHLLGEVSLLRGQQTIYADDIRIEKSTEKIEASGNAIFSDPSYRLKSQRIAIDNRNERALFEQPVFELRGRHASGKAGQVEKLDQYRSRFTGLEYTTCDPDDRDWHLRADSMEIDDESGRGSARHTTLYFKNLPFFYLPYFQFPVDDRRMSGVLAPAVGYSESSGLNIAIPIYWNLAANYDMTITPDWYGERGLQLNTENRYLFESQRGQLDLSYLDDSELGDSRWFQRWQHHADFSYDVAADLLLARVSDGEIFDDFDRLAPEYKDTTHLERHVSFRRQGETWQSRLLWQQYQTLDPTTTTENRPYNRLPRLSIDGTPDPLIDGVQNPLHFEWVEFDRDDSITGSRANLVSTLNWRDEASWYFFEPELQLAFTDYRLDNNPADNRIFRTLPTLSIDSGLVFERVAGGHGQWVQTLEPRLYLLHTPFEDQSAIPDFDTSVSARTYNNLFRNNRFTGVDRIGDASQLTLGLASRVFDNDSGDERLQLRAGQVFYFEDRRVSLDGSTDTENRSDLISELDIWPNDRVKISARLVYDETSRDWDERDLSINYAHQGLAANLGYYFTDQELEQALVSLVYPISDRWTAVAKIHHSLRFERPVENLLGLNYESCCWGLKMLAGQIGDEADDFAEPENSIYFEITLKGLSQAGRDIDTQLRQAIPGYQSEF